jgi:TatD DNase family protein
MIDSHCHLAADEFADDVEAVVSRARAAGVRGALCILEAGRDVEQERAGGLQRLWDAIRFAVGVHPHEAGAWAGRATAAVDLVRRRLAANPAARAIGEIGLDYHYDFAPRAVQREVFAAQAALALELDLPVVVHAREADADVVAVVREVGADRLRGVFHCFTGDARLARQALDLGFYVSLSGIVSFPKAGALREVARLLPGDRLLVETDSPYLAPVPYRGQRNEPARVVAVAAAVAAARGEPAARLEARTTANYEALFGP